MESWYCEGCDEIHHEGQTCSAGNGKAEMYAPSKLITFLAGYLVEWDDDEGPNDIFFREQKWADCRADEVRTCGFEGVTVTPLYKQVAR